MILALPADARSQWALLGSIFGDFHYHHLISLDQFSTSTLKIFDFLYLGNLFFSPSTLCEYFHNTCAVGGMIEVYYHPNYKSYVGSPLAGLPTLRIFL